MKHQLIYQNDNAAVGTRFRPTASGVKVEVVVSHIVQTKPTTEHVLNVTKA